MHINELIDRFLTLISEDQDQLTAGQLQGWQGEYDLVTDELEIKADEHNISFGYLVASNILYRDIARKVIFNDALFIEMFHRAKPAIERLEELVNGNTGNYWLLSHTGTLISKNDI